ncbi:MAG TPA: SGNH/GDSL hydrolase family protein [Streptosporangiaceae bacterium]
MRIAAAAALTVAVAILTGIAVVLASPGTPPVRAIAAATLSPSPAPHHQAPPITHHVRSVTACAQQLARDHNGHLLVVVGASFTAGVGPGTADRSWAVVLARSMGWNAVVYGVPGAGYVRRGAGYRGPVTAELTRIELSALHPDLIIVQAGHDDIGIDPQLEQQQVEETIAQVHSDAPNARIALVTVFPGRAKLARAWLTDGAIVAGATAADPNVIIMDPLAGNWAYQRGEDGLHPTVAGSDWLANEIAGILHGYGVTGTGDLDGRLILCDYSSVGKHKRIKVPPPAGASARMDPP